jgi:hypothetical protein
VLSCATARERPTGIDEEQLSSEVSSIEVIAPAPESTVPSDDQFVAAVEAFGRIAALEVVVKRVALADTLFQERRTYDPPEIELALSFDIPVPDLVTGVYLEVFGVVEDHRGERILSVPVFVMVVECDLFPDACGEQ